jgi:hypothetical protein
MERAESFRGSGARIAEVALKSSANQTAVSLTNWMTAANVHYPVGQ